VTSADELPDEPGTAAVPTFDALMWPTLQALKAMGGSGTNEELLAKVIEVAMLFRRRGCEKVAPAGQFETDGGDPLTCPP
jgi:hypothetical protein